MSDSESAATQDDEQSDVEAATGAPAKRSGSIVWLLVLPVSIVIVLGV